MPVIVMVDWKAIDAVIVATEMPRLRYRKVRIAAPAIPAKPITLLEVLAIQE
ncbi:hypothetical protein D3C73_1215180 [compost metagenome]